MSGGKAVLLGGANEFWEYIQEYYGVTSILELKDKPLLLLDSLKQCIKQEKALSHSQDTKLVTIIGAAHPMASLLVMDLLHSAELVRNGTLTIRLYDHIAFKRILEQLEWDSCALGSAAGFSSVRVIPQLEDALHGSNVIIFLQHKDCCRHEGQSLMDWLNYNYNSMVEIAGAINAYASEDCRIILTGAGTLPLCFNVNVIAEFATHIQAHNIVAVTADLAQEAIRTTALSMGLSSGSVGQPSVWGCIGLNNLVDIKNAAHVLEVLTKTSKLDSLKGSVFVRPICYLLENENKIYSRIQKEKNVTEELLDRSLYIAKVKATTDLLKHWYGIKNNSRAILSLGIISDGSFGIPFGLCFSQPVQLVDGCWRPYKAQHLSQEFKIQLRSLLYFPCQIMKQFNIGGRFESKWLLTSKERQKIAQLNQIKQRGAKPQKESQNDLADMSEEIKKKDQKQYVRIMLSQINNMTKQEKQSRDMKMREQFGEASMIDKEGLQIAAKAAHGKEMKEILWNQIETRIAALRY